MTDDRAVKVIRDPYAPGGFRFEYVDPEPDEDDDDAGTLREYLEDQAGPVEEYGELSGGLNPSGIEHEESVQDWLLHRKALISFDKNRGFYNGRDPIDRDTLR